jgi:hypothetical protein
MSREIEEIYQRLLARDYALTLFGDLEKKRKAGRGYTALCPFHKEKPPPFSFSMDKPVYHCFGCGESGDWIRYLEKKEGLWRRPHSLLVLQPSFVVFHQFLQILFPQVLHNEGTYLHACLLLSHSLDTLLTSFPIPVFVSQVLYQPMQNLCAALRASISHTLADF